MRRKDPSLVRTNPLIRFTAVPTANQPPGQGQSAKSKAATAAEVAAAEAERLHTAVLNSAIGVEITDTEGHFVTVNPAFCSITGYSKEDLRSKDWVSLTHPDDRQRSLALARRAFAGELESILYEKRYITKAGGTVWVRNSVSVVRDSSGTPTNFIALVEDITAFKLAEAARCETEDRYRDLVENSQDLLCTHDLAGKLLSCNPAPARILGYTVEEMLQTPMRDFIAPEHRDEFEEYLARVRKDGIAKGLMVAITRTGERRVWEYHNTLRTQGVPRPIVRGMAHDITERLRAEADVRSLMAIAEKLNSTLEIDELLDALLIEAMKLTGADLGWSGERTPEGMVCHSHYERSRKVPFRYCWPPGVGMPGWVLQHKVPYLAADTGHDPVVLPELRKRFRMKSELAVPIIDAHGEVIGFLAVIKTKEGAGFTAADVGKLTAVCQTASMALQHALAYQKLKQAEESLRRLSASLLRSQEEEHRRIARELHDSTSQNLAALVMTLGSLKKATARLDEETREAVAASLALARESAREVQTFSYLLHPPMLDEFGLADALRWYARGFSERSGIEVTLRLARRLRRLPSDVETALFRVVQEGLNNVRRHSGSKRAAIRLRFLQDYLVLEVKDFGRGMKTRPSTRESKEPRTLGIGIPGMQERLQQLGGELQLASSSQGTLLRAILPMAPRAA